MKHLFVLLLAWGFFLKAWGQRDQSFEDLFNKLLKNFETEMGRDMKRLENFFQKGSFLGIDKISPFDETKVEPFWRETEKQRILVFKVEASDNGIPFNIQIVDGYITVKGTVQKQQRSVDPNTGATSFSSNVYQFQHGPVPIPSDVDESGVKIEKEKGEVLIRFPKKKKAGTADKPKKSTKPLPRRKGDITI